MDTTASLRDQVHAAVERLTDEELATALELLANLHDAEDEWADWHELAGAGLARFYEDEPEIYTLDDAMPRSRS